MNLKMKIILISLLLFCSCNLVVDPVFCRTNHDCFSGEVCSNKVCVNNNSYKSGYILLGCGCYEYYYGQNYNSVCYSGYETPFYCSGYCWDGNYSYGIMCE